MSEKPSIDWESIERDYRLGMLSVRELAAKNNITHPAIMKRAKLYRWDRDLSARVKLKADALVTKRTVTAAVTAEGLVTERMMVDATAQVIADVRMAHRTDIGRARTLVMALLEELESQTANRELYEQMPEMMAAPDDKGYDKLNELYKKVISLSGRSTTMKQIAESMRVLVTMEREAYSIGDVDPQSKVSDKNEAIGSALKSLAERLPV